MDFEDTPVGREFRIEPLRIEKEKILAFAREYDPLPVHLDEEYARGTRYKTLLAPGVMCFMSAWSRFISRNPWGDNLIAGKSTKIEWLAPVHADDTLHGVATVTGKSRRNPHNGIVIITTDLFNQDSTHVIHDTTEMIVAGPVRPGNTEA